VEEARLEPWSIIFCSIPHLVQKRREKSDGLFVIDVQNKWEANTSIIQVGSHVSHSLEPFAAFFFGMGSSLIISLATDQKHKTPCVCILVLEKEPGRDLSLERGNDSCRPLLLPNPATGWNICDAHNKVTMIC
jgi:hypothetical protein